MSLRSFIGFALFLCAGDLPAQAIADDRSLLNDSRSLLEQLQTQAPHELTEQEKKKLDEENKQLEDIRKRHEENSLNISRTLTERRSLLQDSDITFEFKYYGSSWEGAPLLAACLIDETGSVYNFVAARDPNAQSMKLSTDERDYLKAINLAKLLRNQILQPRGVGADFATRIWTINYGSDQHLLMIEGNYFGALSDVPAIELLSLIDGWCPYSREARSPYPK
jgi:hypothetical protein